MRKIIATIKSISAYSQSRCHETPALDKEGKDAYAKRTWREHSHVNNEGNVIIPPTALKNGITAAAKFLGVQIPGRGKERYTKHFESGVLVVDPIVLPVKKDDIACERLFLPSDGVRGSGKRVWKYFPVIPVWGGDAVIYVLDNVITKDIVDMHLEAFGQFVGLGRFRPANNGYYGRFEIVKSVELTD